MTDTYKLTAQQKDDASSTFKLFDKKDLGKIGITDLIQVFRSCAMTISSETLSEWVDDLGCEDDMVNMEQFCAMYARKKKIDEDEKEIKEAFRVLDKHKQGVIDVEDLRWILKSLGDDVTDEEIEDMIQATDVDGSGTVDYEEFSTLMNG